MAPLKNPDYQTKSEFIAFYPLHTVLVAVQEEQEHGLAPGLLRLQSSLPYTNELDGKDRGEE